VLDGLENSPYKDNTMIILWSDHGYSLGEKLHVTKFALWDDAAQVNFFVKDPRNPQSAGKKCYRPVSLMDIYPTVMNLAGLDLPSKRITGHDLTPLLKNPKATRSAPAHSTYADVNNNLVRQERYKLIRYQDGSQELYDIPSDPEEFENLADSKKHRRTKSRMEKIFQTAIAEGSY